MGLYDLVSLSTTVTAQSGATVTLASVAGLEVGDRIVIESQHGYDETGLDGDWAITLPTPTTNYYLNVSHIGKSFIGTIQSGGISGNTITLDRTVPAGAVGLPCYRENGAAVKYALENRVRWPNGQSFAIASDNTAPIRAYLPDDFMEIDFRNCELFAPRGCGALGLHIARSGGGGVSNKHYRNLRLRGNVKTSGYGFFAESGTYTAGSSTAGAFTVAGTTGGGATTAANCTVENFTCTDNWRAVTLDVAADSLVVDCDAFFTDPLKAYIQWEFQAASCRRCAFVRCRVDGDYARAGFEAFKSQGVGFYSCSGRNATYSSNTSGGVLFKDCLVVWDEEDPDSSFSANNPLMTINRIIEDQQNSPQSSAVGGVGVRDFSAVYNAIPYPSTSRILNTILVTAGTEGINTDADIRGVSLSVPRTDVSVPNPGYIVRSDAAETVVSGISGSTLDSGSKYTLQNVDQGI